MVYFGTPRHAGSGQPIKVLQHWAIYMNVQELEKITGGGGMAHCVKILHLEDSPEDAELIRGIMDNEGLACDVTLISQQALFEMEIEKRPFDLILCDHGIPGYNGFTALAYARKRRPDIPVIMLSGSLDDAQAVESLPKSWSHRLYSETKARPPCSRHPPRSARGAGAEKTTGLRRAHS